MASDQSEQMSDITINVAVKQFGSSFCIQTANWAKEAAEKIYDCYQQVLKDNSDPEVCFLGDNAVTSIVEAVQQRSEALGRINPFEGMSFFSEEEILKRTREKYKLSKYQNYTLQEKIDYQIKSTRIFIDKVNSSCKFSSWLNFLF